MSISQRALSLARAPAPRQPAKVIAFKRRQDYPFSYGSGNRWFAIFTRPQCERQVQLEIEHRGHRTFLPQKRVWVSHARVKKAVARPLMPRYLFVEVEPNKQGFGGIHDVVGVEYLLGADGVPEPMPDGFVEEFLRRQLRGEFDLVSKDEEGNARPIPVGAKICIMDGPYSDSFAIIVGRGKKSGGEVLAQLLGQRIRTRLSMFSVRPA
jgi:transcriptional antiterminator RfaH